MEISFIFYAPSPTNHKQEADSSQLYKQTRAGFTNTVNVWAGSSVMLWHLVHHHCASGLLSLLAEGRKMFSLTCFCLRPAAAACWKCVQTNWKSISISVNVKKRRKKNTFSFSFLNHTHSADSPLRMIFLKQMFFFFFFLCHDTTMTPNQIVFWWFLSAIYLFCSLEIKCNVCRIYKKKKIVICKPWEIYITTQTLFFTDWADVHFSVSMNHRNKKTSDATNILTLF